MISRKSLTRSPLPVLTVLAGCLYAWGVSRGGGHYYYSAAVRTMSEDWSAFWYGSLDPALSMTIDKAAGSLWLQALFVRLLGFHTWVLLLPGVLAATATVPLLYGAVRRWSGNAAAVVAAVVFVLSPVTFVTMRVNLADSVLVCCLVAAAYLLTRYFEDPRRRWLLGSAALVGVAFQVKMIEAWLILPAMTLALLIRPGRAKPLRAAMFLGISVAVSLSWLVITGLIPRSARPHVDGSASDSFWEMVFRYNGIGRAESDGTMLAATAAPYGGEPGPLRLFNDQLGGQIGWLLPLALVLLVAGWWVHRRDPGWAMWGGWLATVVVVLSAVGGLHPYYATVLVPALAAVLGAGTTAAWRTWRERSLLRWVLPAGFALSAAVALVAVTRASLWWLAATIAVCAIGTALAYGRERTAATLATVAVLIGPAAWIAVTPAVPRNSMHSTNPVAGPQTAKTVFGNSDPRVTLSLILGMPATGPVPPIDAPLPGADIDPDLLGYLVARHRGERYLFATGDASTASPYLADGHSVLPAGGFTAFSPYPTEDELTSLVRGGQLRFVYFVSAPHLPGVLGERAEWASRNCAVVDPAAYRGRPGGMTLFDCPR